MSNEVGRETALTYNSTTNEPVTFVVESPRAQAVASSLPYELQEMYIRAWRDAIGAVMDDCGWTYEAPQNATVAEVERIRTGRPRVIHGTQIDLQLNRAVKAVDDILGSILQADSEALAALDEARRRNLVAFKWRITESYVDAPGREPGTRELLGSSYIDLTFESDENISA